MRPPGRARHKAGRGPSSGASLRLPMGRACVRRGELVRLPTLLRRPPTTGIVCTQLNLADAVDFAATRCKQVGRAAGGESHLAVCLGSPPSPRSHRSPLLTYPRPPHAYTHTLSRMSLQSLLLSSPGLCGALRHRARRGGQRGHRPDYPLHPRPPRLHAVSAGGAAWRVARAAAPGRRGGWTGHHVAGASAVRRPAAAALGSCRPLTHAVHPHPHLRPHPHPATSCSKTVRGPWWSSTWAARTAPLWPTCGITRAAAACRPSTFASAGGDQDVTIRWGRRGSALVLVCVCVCAEKERGRQAQGWPAAARPDSPASTRLAPSCFCLPAHRTTCPPPLLQAVGSGRRHL